MEEAPRIGKFIKTESRTEVTKVSGEGQTGSHCLEDAVSIWNDDKF